MSDLSRVLRGFERQDGIWMHVLDDNSLIDERDEWKHVPELVALARDAAHFRLAAAAMRRALVDWWAQPVLDRMVTQKSAPTRRDG